MIVDYAVYRDGQRVEEQIALGELFEHSRDRNSFAWIGLHEPTPEEFDAVRREFDLHELAVEDAVNAHQRPKLEKYEDSVFIVLKTASYREDHIEFGEILVFVGEGFLVTVRHGDTALHDVRERMEQRPDLLKHGPSAAVYAIIDRVVDDYQPVVEELDSDIQEVEIQVFSPSPERPTARIYALNRAVLRLAQAALPLEPVMEMLSSGLHPVPDDLRPYFRDVHDHLLRIRGRIIEFRELLGTILQANITQASFRQNEDVRKISAWAAIIAVPTLITGVYGMNFEHMPELTWRVGYPLTIAVMVAACIGLYWRFRRSGWL